MKKHNNNKRMLKRKETITGNEALKRLVILILLIAAILVPFSFQQILDRYNQNIIESQWQSFMRIGDAYMKRGDFLDAMTYYNEAYQLGTTYRKPPMKIKALNSLGRANYTYGDYEKSVEDFNMAFAVVNNQKKYRDYDTLASLYRNLGNAYEYSKVDFKEIKETYKKAMDFAQKSQKKNYDVIIDISTNSAVRNYSDAIKYINEYLEVAKAKNDKVLEISLLSKLSTSYFFSSSKSKAEEYAAIAKSRFNELGKEDVSCVSCGVASALYQLGECEDAMPILEKGLKAAINEKNELAQSAQLTVIGYCQEKDKKYKDAMATVEKNIELHKAMYRADHHYIQFFERKLKEIKEKANAK